MLILCDILVALSHIEIILGAVSNSWSSSPNFHTSANEDIFVRTQK